LKKFTSVPPCERLCSWDPYGIIHDLSPEEECIGALLFARAPGSVWVSEYELPSATVDALMTRIKQEPDDFPFFLEFSSSVATRHHAHRNLGEPMEKAAASATP
jgi:hypothetical protein